MIRVGSKRQKFTRPPSRIKQGQRLITQHGKLWNSSISCYMAWRLAREHMALIIREEQV